MIFQPKILLNKNINLKSLKIFNVFRYNRSMLKNYFLYLGRYFSYHVLKIYLFHKITILVIINFIILNRSSLDYIIFSGEYIRYISLTV